MKKIIMCLIALTLTACASNDNNDLLASNDPDINRKNAEGYQCKKEKITGSNFPRKVCTTAAERKAREIKDQEELKRGTRNNIPQGY